MWTFVDYVRVDQMLLLKEHIRGSVVGIRPVVTLKSDEIDLSNPTDNSGQDGYAWNLK